MIQCDTGNVAMDGILDIAGQLMTAVVDRRTRFVEPSHKRSQMKPMIVVPTGTLSDESMSVLRENGVCVVAAEASF
jgi:hypothetical protein